jgi:hypothetical protein
MSTSICPVSQYDAIPMLAATQFVANEGDFYAFPPGAMVREFSPVDTGINGVVGNYSENNPPDAYWLAVSNPLDVRGCQYFTLLYAIKMREQAHDINNAFTVRIQALVAADAPAPLVPRHRGSDASSWEYPGTLTLPQAYPSGSFPPRTVPADPASCPIVYKSCTMSWRVGDRFITGGLQQTGALGRIIIWIRGTGVAGTAYSHQEARIYVSLIASS